MTTIRPPHEAPKTPDGAVPDALQARTSYYRRLLSRGGGKNQSCLRKLQVARAATLAALAEITLNDPTATVSSKIGIERASRRALLDLKKMIEADKPAAPVETLQQYVARKHAKAGAAA